MSTHPQFCMCLTIADATVTNSATVAAVIRMIIFIRNLGSDDETCEFSSSHGSVCIDY